VHCYQDNFTRSGELDRTQLKLISDNIISTLKRWGQKGEITLTGGEPFLKEEVWWLADYLASSEQISGLGFITNGTFIDKHIAELKSIKKLSEILISLDGATKDVNDSIRGRSTFENVIENIKLLKSEKFNVALMFTLLKRNYDDAGLLYDFARSLNLDGYIIERFIPLGTGNKIRDEVVSGKEICRLYEHIFDQCDAEFNDSEIAQYHALRVRFNGGGSAALFGAVCIVGMDGLAILCDGRVLPCRRFHLPVGNLLNQSLYDIWNSSEILIKLRDKVNMKGKCRICNLSNCRGCRAGAFALSGDYLAEDPHCWL
jgi:radical SAM protein with 4Fe4S-binding SPASM domain